MNDGLSRHGLWASAIARRPLDVAAAQPGEPAWTDGKAIFVDVQASPRAQIQALAVQASLLSAGSLDHDIVRALTRRPKLARRYLAVEGHRALAAVEPLLPPSVASLIAAEVAALSGSPAVSLALARSPKAAVDPPASFGTIRPRRLRALAELAELGDQASSEDQTEDGFASSLAGGGVIGRWFSRMLTVARTRHGSGSPGADAPTDMTHASRHGGSAAVLSNATAQTPIGLVRERTFEGRAHGIQYPEWDLHARRYRQSWCTVLEAEPTLEQEPAQDFVLDRSGLRRALARLGTDVDSRHRRDQGEDIDIDAVVAARVDMMTGATPGDALFIDSVRRRRNLSVLLLLDVSGSAGEPAASGQRTVHAEQGAAAVALSLTLHELGDRVALYAYRSQGRDAVHVVPIKRFGEDPRAVVQQRVAGLMPSAYSRLGAAIRHGAAILRRHGGTPRQVLVVLSDGLAYDHGYELGYGAADSRRALEEARNQGIGCLCLTIGASTDPEALRRVFGASAHASLSAPEQLQRVIAPLFRSAVRAADVSRRDRTP